MTGPERPVAAQSDRPDSAGPRRWWPNPNGEPSGFPGFVPPSPGGRTARESTRVGPDPTPGLQAGTWWIPPAPSQGGPRCLGQRDRDEAPHPDHQSADSGGVRVARLGARARRGSRASWSAGLGSDGCRCGRRGNHRRHRVKPRQSSGRVDIDDNQLRDTSHRGPAHAQQSHRALPNPQRRPGPILVGRSRRPNRRYLPLLENGGNFVSTGHQKSVVLPLTNKGSICLQVEIDRSGPVSAPSSVVCSGD